QELAANPDGNLLPKQIEYATIIRSSGTDLLKLINDILDISKIESGTVALDISNWPLEELKPMLERTFRHVAEATKLAFAIDLRSDLPQTIPTDPQRLQQILNNLLSNAFKFTERGKVRLQGEPGVGSIFTVYLPLIAPAHPRRGAPSETMEAAAGIAPQPVLVGAGGHGPLKSEAVEQTSGGNGFAAAKSLLVVEDD